MICGLSDLPFIRIHIHMYCCREDILSSPPATLYPAWLNGVLDLFSDGVDIARDMDCDN